MASSAVAYMVTEKNLPLYIEMVTAKFYPRSVLYVNTAILKMKNRVQADIIVDGWPEFNCTVARLPESEEDNEILFLLAGSQEKLEHFLIALNYNGDVLLGALDDETNRYLSGMKKTWPFGLEEKVLAIMKGYYFPGKLEDIIKWSCPEGTFVATLKPDTCTVKMLAETWSYGSLESKTKYLKFIIENCGSIGVFLKDDPTHPVSWAMFSNFGHLMHVYTLSEHRGKGYAKTAVLGIMKEMLEIGMTPVLEIVKGNAASTKMFAGLGFVEAYSATWKKYL